MAHPGLPLASLHGNASPGGGEVLLRGLSSPLGSSQRQGMAGAGAAGAAGQQLAVNTGLHSRGDFTASPLQAEAINALRGWDARLHPLLDDKPREKKEKQK